MKFLTIFFLPYLNVTQKAFLKSLCLDRIHTGWVCEVSDPELLPSLNLMSQFDKKKKLCPYNSMTDDYNFISYSFTFLLLFLFLIIHHIILCLDIFNNVLLEIFSHS